MLAAAAPFVACAWRKRELPTAILVPFLLVFYVPALSISFLLVISPLNVVAWLAGLAVAMVAFKLCKPKWLT